MPDRSPRALSRHTGRLLAASLLTALAAPVAAAAPAATAVASTGSPSTGNEVWARPADGVFRLEGRGFGHGYGLSQWGAQGAALRGLDADAILDHYYRGSRRGTVSTATRLRVRLAGLPRINAAGHPTDDLRFRDVNGLAVRAAGASLDLPATIGGARVSSWRVVQTARGLRLQGWAASAWRAPAASGTWSTYLAGPVDVAPASGPAWVRVVRPDGTRRDYRGSLRAARGGDGLVAVDVVPLETYLRSVVPSEAIPSWRPAALRAQAVAARTYVEYKRRHAAPGRAYDAWSDTRDQAYSGWRSLPPAEDRSTSVEQPSTDAAVLATAGQVRVDAGGAVLFAQFGAASGGWTNAGSAPYLQAVADPYDGVVPTGAHAWTAALPASTLERRYPAIGRLLRVRVTARNGFGEWGGRVTGLVLEGDRGSRSIGGSEAVRSALGLRSGWVRAAPVSTGSAASSRRPSGRG